MQGITLRAPYLHSWPSTYSWAHVNKHSTNPKFIPHLYGVCIRVKTHDLHCASYCCYRRFFFFCPNCILLSLLSPATNPVSASSLLLGSVRLMLTFSCLPLAAPSAQVNCESPLAATCEWMLKYVNVNVNVEVCECEWMLKYVNETCMQWTHTSHMFQQSLAVCLAHDQAQRSAWCNGHFLHKHNTITMCGQWAWV